MTKSAFDEIRRDDFEVAHEPQQLALFLINTLEDHAHLRDAQVAFLFRDHEITRGGKIELGSMHLPRLHGAGAKHWGPFIRWALTNLLGYQPDFVAFIDRNAWAGMDERQKLALVDHELLHAEQSKDAEGNPRFNQLTGEPIYGIRPHDLEEFQAVAQRHGAWSTDLVEMARALIDSLNHGPSLELPTDVRKQTAG